MNLILDDVLDLFRPGNLYDRSQEYVLQRRMFALQRSGSARVSPPYSRIIRRWRR